MKVVTALESVMARGVGNVGPMPEFESSVLSLERDGTVATLWLDRPGARNAMGRAFWADLPRAMEEVAADPDLRVVLVAARGPHFSVGLDLKEMGAVLASGDDAAGREAAPRGEPERRAGASARPRGPVAAPSPAARASATRAAIVRMQAAVTSVASCPKPVIAAIQGYCIGGGVDLASACDIRLAASDAVFSVRETKLAIVADLGSLQRLPHIVGGGIVAELALTGRDVGSGRAREIGLVNEVYDDHEALWSGARQMAQEIAALSPLSVQGTKAVLAASQGRSVADGLDYVATWNAGMLVSDDLSEAMIAFARKRPPEFTGH